MFLQVLALACLYYLWLVSQGTEEGLPASAESGNGPFSAGMALSCPCIPWCCSLELLQENWLLYTCCFLCTWCMGLQVLRDGSQGHLWCMAGMTC